MRKRRNIIGAAAAVVLCVLAGAWAATRHGSPETSSSGIPTSVVKRGDLEMPVYATGELRASHFEMMAAPPIGGGSLEITWSVIQPTEVASELPKSAREAG